MYIKHYLMNKMATLLQMYSPYFDQDGFRFEQRRDNLSVKAIRQKQNGGFTAHVRPNFVGDRFSLVETGHVCHLRQGTGQQLLEILPMVIF